MSDPGSREHCESRALRIGGIEDERVHVEEVAHVIEDHHHDHEAAQQIDGIEPRTPSARESGGGGGSWNG